MKRIVNYYFSVASPWSYLGSGRFIDLVRHYQPSVKVMPLDFARVLAESGGTLFEKRAIQRREYRQIELRRWSRRLNLPLNLKPRFYPVDRQPASCLIIGARGHENTLQVLTLSHAVLRAIWTEDRNIADWETLEEICNQAGFDGAAMVEKAQRPETAAQYEDDTTSAIAAHVFGAPTYVIDGEPFWGQDRLDFVEEKLRNDEDGLRLDRAGCLE